MNLTKEAKDALLNASIIVSSVDTDECKDLASAMECAAKTGSEKALKYVADNGPSIHKDLLMEASMDAWLPANWEANPGEIETVAQMAYMRERQAGAVKEAVAIAAQNTLVLA